MSVKFKVGDVVRSSHNIINKYVIVKVIKSKGYHVKHIGSGHVFDSRHYGHSLFKLDCKRIKDTKIARKMNKNSILKEEDGYITVRIT